MYIHSKIIVRDSSKVYNYTKQCFKLYGRKFFFRTSGKVSLTHQELLSYGVYEITTKTIHYLNALIIDTAYNANLAAKLTIT